ncbi:hypothetical protein STXM2123_5690 [Streptomyces sp. F-3]|jgi:hypothetical protein|uniref:MmpS family membrane protein n=1 Tax=Streptomyces thermogriseus TaxID=75292 RepID=A0ABP4DNH0_9ACTN|nr:MULTISPECIES: MmpS family transport accessory protein [Streptomyces]MDN5384828.1 MmpS family transport accessory protein [Streptomyces sp. LB8]GAT84989.1 hypothetical protein STXM2123_5690 [Streptomyces sp. F-3]
MNRIRRRIVSALAAGGLVLGLGACSEDTARQVEDEVVKEVDKQVNKEYEVTYEVTGDGVDSITFNAGGGDAASPKLETVNNPTLPWKKTVKLRGIEAPTVIPVAVDISADNISCRIVYEGRTLVEKSGAGVVSAAGCVAVSPIVD